MPQVSGNVISGAGGYGSYPGNLYRDRYDWIIMPGGEIRHLGTSLVIGTIVRNPYVSAGLGVLHGLSHLFEVTIGNMYEIGFSPGGGGPGQSLTSTNTPPSIEEVGRMITAPPKSEATKQGEKMAQWLSSTRSRRRCPPGYRWDKKRRKCVRIRKY